MGLRDGFKRASKAAASLAQQSDLVAQTAEHAKVVADAAMSEAKLRNRQGEVTKVRLAGAILRPTGTGRKLVKGALTEAVRQGQNRAAPSSEDAASALTSSDIKGEFKG